MPGQAWEVLDEQEVFAARPWIAVRRQRVRTDQGVEIDDYYQVDFREFAVAVALTEEGQVLTLWQYKHGTGCFGLTFPAGIMEPGEPAEDAMRRELLEETGYEAKSARSLGRFACNCNQTAGWANLFLLEGCVRVAEPDSGDLEAIEVRVMSPQAVDQAAMSGAIKGLPHIAVWTLARHQWPAPLG